MPPPAVLALFPSLLVPLLLVAFPASVWPAVVAYHAYCLGVAVAVAEPRDLHLPATSRHPYRFIVVVAIILAAGAEAAARGYPDLRGWLPDGWPDLARRATPWAAFAAYSLVVNPYVEERFWREAMLPMTGILAGAMAFGLMHAVAGLVLLGPLAAAVAGLSSTFAGVVWGVAARRYQAIWPCVLTHIAADAAILRVLWAFQAPS